MDIEVKWLEWPGWQEWTKWLTAGINLFFVLAAAAALVIAVIYLWRNYKLEALIVDYQKKEKEASLQLRARTDAQSSIYSNMVPLELLDILDIKEAEDVSLEKHKSVQAVNMSVNSSEFSSLIHSMGAGEFFAFINGFARRAVPMIYEAGGIVQEYRQAGMNVLFLKDYEKALAAAVSICELWNEPGQEMTQYDYDITIAMTYEDAITGLVGDRRRMELFVLSAESCGLSDWLCGIAAKYYARILVTETYAQQIRDFQKKFHTRLTGYVYIRDTGSIQKIYDVFDGDEKEVRNRKRQTKIVFEKGVSLFAQQQFQEARLYFIEVLKTDRFDCAAKEYIYRCEKWMKNPQEAGEICIERYG